MDEMKALSRINKFRQLNKTRKAGLFICVGLLMLNFFTFEYSGSIYSDIGVMVSLAGSLYFIVDSKGY